MLIYILIIMISFLVLFPMLYYKIKFKKTSINNFQKYNNLLKDYLIYPFQLLSYNNYNFISKMISTKVKISIKNIHGEYLRQNKEIEFISKKLTIIYYIFLISSIVILFNPNILIFTALLSFITFLYFYIDYSELNKFNQMQKKFKSDLPNFISRLALLIGSGMQIRIAIDSIIKHTDGEVVNRLKIVNMYIRNGLSESKAYNKLLNETDDILIRKFLVTIIQNIEKGGDEIIRILELIKKESDEFRKNEMVLKTQEANQKLLIPNLLIFSGIMLIVMVPVILNLF